jgi:hypothetical protein
MLSKGAAGAQPSRRAGAGAQGWPASLLILLGLLAFAHIKIGHPPEACDARRAALRPFWFTLALSHLLIYIVNRSHSSLQSLVRWSGRS